MLSANLFYVNGKLNNFRIKETYIKEKLHDEYIKILEHHTTFFIGLNFTFSQKLYNYINSIKHIPLCKCGKQLSFSNFTKGYKHHCSVKCAANDSNIINRRISNRSEDLIKEKTRQTNFERYGGHPMQSDKIKEKVKKTNLERYGVKNPYQSNEIKDKIKQTNLERYGVKNPYQSNEIKDKIKQTNLERYGGHPMQSDKIKEKVKKTNLERYGVECSLNNSEIKDKIKQTNLERYGGHPMHNNIVKGKVKDSYNKKYLSKISNNYNIDIINNSKGLLEIKCNKCYKIFTIQTQLMRLRTSLNLEICTYCNPLYSYKINSFESDIYDYLKSIYSDEISKNNRRILNGLELDFYIPEKKIAIEFNGLYWHSELFKESDYHLKKTLECQKQDIKLIHIFEDEWIYKQEIVKSRVKNILGLNENKIFARKTEVKEVDSINANQFLKENHIQGPINSKIRLGLYYNDELISLMTFGSLRKSMGSKSEENNYELLRFCNKLNTSVIGGASKLFKYFLNDYKPIKVISYADRRWSNGNLYRQLGFKELEPSKPNYWYIINNKREYRFKYRKSELVKQGFDKDKSEHDIMLERGIYKIYDSGNLKFEFLLKFHN